MHTCPQYVLHSHNVDASQTMFRTGPWKTSKQCSTRVFLWGALDLFWTLLAVRGFLGLSWGLSRDYRKLYGLSWDYREVSWDRCFFGQFGASLVFPWVSGPRADNIATKCPKALGDGCFLAYPGQPGAILIPFLWAFFCWIPEAKSKPRADNIRLRECLSECSLDQGLLGSVFLWFSSG